MYLGAEISEKNGIFSELADAGIRQIPLRFHKELFRRDAHLGNQPDTFNEQ